MVEVKYGYRIIKKIGEGVHGTIFEIEKNGLRYAMKIQKIPEDHLKKDYSKPFWREIKFSEFTSKYPDQFNQLIEYKIVDKCEYERRRPKSFSRWRPEWREKYRIREASSYSSVLIYELLDGPVRGNIKKFSKEQIYSYIIQMTYIDYLLQNAGFRHNDLHDANIMYKKVPYDTKINILGHDIPTFGYIFSAIDFGSVIHKDFNRTSKEIERMENFANDMRFIIYSLMASKFHGFIQGNNYRMRKINDAVNLIKHEPEYDIIKKFTIKNYPWTNEQIIYHLFYILNPERLYQIIDIDDRVDDYSKYITENYADPEDLFYLWTHITQPIKIIQYFADKIL